MIPWTFAERRNMRDAAPEFIASKAAERAYRRKLQSLAGKVKEILAGASPDEAAGILHQYAEHIAPWARQAAESMLSGVDRKNYETFIRAAERQGVDIRRVLNSPGVGDAIQRRIDENVKLIKSIVTHSADQVSELIKESMATGMRAEDLQKRIEHVGEVSRSRANTIAVTEVSKASTALTMARAQDCGSEGYIWRTTRDGATRPSHRAMEGKFVRWDSPPTLDNMTGHAGEFPNCRCYPEPVLKRSNGSAYSQPLPTQEEEKAAGEQNLFGVWERTVPSGKGEEWPEVVRHMPGTLLYNVEKAKFLPEKLTKYSMSRDHSPEGAAKAEAFEKYLAFTLQDAEKVERLAMEGIKHLPAERGTADNRGERFAVYVPMKGNNGMTADVLTAWIYERKDGRLSTIPRLVNCFLNKRSIRSVRMEV